MKAIATNQAWSLLGPNDKTRHTVTGNLGTVSNDSSSDYGVIVTKNGEPIGNVNPGDSETFSTTPGDIVVVVSGSGAMSNEFASGQILS